MSPYEKAERLYLASPEAHPFAWYVDYHLRHAFVFNRPDFFVMGRPVIRSAPRELVTDCTHRFPSHECDAWFFFAMAGNMAPMWALLPWPMPYFGWERERWGVKELQFFDCERIKRICPPPQTCTT